MARVRTAIRTQGKIAITYRDLADHDSKRVIWPIAVSYWETVRLIVAWCELRKGFRHFRTDRIAAFEFLEAKYPTTRARLRVQWRKEMEGEQERRPYPRHRAAANLNEPPAPSPMGQRVE